MPPRQTFTAIGLAVTEKAPFTLAVKFDQPSTALGKPANLTITAVRKPGFTEEIALTRDRPAGERGAGAEEHPGQHDRD